MNISFCCRACRSKLQADASCAGREIRCPRCGQITKIPESVELEPAAEKIPEAARPVDKFADADAAPKGDRSEIVPPPVRSELDFCAFFEPNPFAFSVALDAPEVRTKTAKGTRLDSENNDRSASAAAETVPTTFRREDFAQTRRSNAESDSSDGVRKDAASNSPSVDEMIAELLDDN